ncbi:MAG: hypothetical protein ACTSQ8_15535 [Candidatus Helarchaeota archaeon]
MGEKISRLMEELNLNENDVRLFLSTNGVKIELFSSDPDEEVSKEDLNAVMDKWHGHPIGHRLADLLSDGHTKHVYWEKDKINEIKNLHHENHAVIDKLFSLLKQWRGYYCHILNC